MLVPPNEVLNPWFRARLPGHLARLECGTRPRSAWRHPGICRSGTPARCCAASGNVGRASKLRQRFLQVLTVPIT